MKIGILYYRHNVTKKISKINKVFHVSDNLEKEKPKNINNKLMNIHSVLDHLRNNCILIEPEREHSIDDQIIPAKAKYSGICQYNP